MPVIQLVVSEQVEAWIAECIRFGESFTLEGAHIEAFGFVARLREITFTLGRPAPATKEENER